MNEIGRLDSDDRIALNLELEEILKLIDKNKIKLAEKRLVKIAKTPNYFVREYIGRYLSKHENPARIEKMAEQMLEHKIYGVRATALFFLYNSHYEEPEQLYKYIERTFDSVPWEVESIINDLWKRYPVMMKENMKSWIDSENSQRRSLSFHGMESIAHEDPVYIMNYIGKAIDDDTIAVQKKITHILSQVAKSNPIIVFPYIREWLAEADETRIKTIWVSMKKLANIVVQKNRHDNREEFVILTEQTIEDWKNDENENVAEMGKRLQRIIVKYSNRY